ANAAFFSVSGTDFVEVWVGGGSSRVRDAFAEARSMAPAIVFIDEIDSIGTHRSAFTTDGGREYERTLNQLLVELDGFEPNSAVVVMAATNRPELLDGALVRPGRFDRMVTIAPPDRAGRLAILRLHAAHKQLGDDVDLDAVAGVTRGLSGADLENILNEAALLATRRGLDRISMAVLDEGVDRATFGLVSHQAMMTDEARSVVAYHEAGHAIVALALPGAMPPHKLTILPRGRTLGHCSMTDTHDRFVWSRTRLLDQMASLLGGWVAERLVFGEAGSGASGDLERVGSLARRMVREWGMSKDLGPLAFPAANGSGRYSEREAGAISIEVRRLADEAQDRATSVLSVSRARLDAVAADLLQRETMTSDEIELLVAGISTSRPMEVSLGL
ncbi:MAG: AAA family ATPase, partial [Acidimicrobiales bacterium]